jgi:thymidylate synthase (FAD)
MSMIKNVMATNINPLVGGLARCLRPMYNHPASIAELAGRICYRSVDKMGHSSSFLHFRAAEGHMDIFEHVWVTAALTDDDEDVRRMADASRYVHVHYHDLSGWSFVSANLRVWMELARSNMIAQDVIAAYLPSMYPVQTQVPIHPAIIRSVNQRTAGQAIINLVGTHRPDAVDVDIDEHSAATFVLENVSRALTHQLVRHRLLSFSQESQRYVDLDKGGWGPIVPPSIGNSPEAASIMSTAWDNLESAYRQLRELGIRKEDARFLLPNAASTTIMVTGSIAAWRHVLNQRCAPDAQWEIRAVAIEIKNILQEMML